MMMMMLMPCIRANYHASLMYQICLMANCSIDSSLLAEKWPKEMSGTLQDILSAERDTY